MTATTDTTDTLAARLRQRLELAQERAFAVPTSMRAAVDRLVGRVRVALDLPSRSELLELTHRLEELDRRIAELAARRVEEMARPIPALPEHTGIEVVEVAPVEVEVARVELAPTPIVVEPAPEAEVAADAAPAPEAPEAPEVSADGDADAESVEATDAAAPGVKPNGKKAGKRNARHRRR